METAERLAKLEKATAMLHGELLALSDRLDEMTEQRNALLADHLALRSAFIALSSHIQDVSAARRAAMKQQASHHLCRELMAAELPEDRAREALEALEEVFYALDEAQIAMDHPSRRSC